MGDCRTDRKCVYGGPSQRALFLIVALPRSLGTLSLSLSQRVKGITRVCESRASARLLPSLLLYSLAPFVLHRKCALNPFPPRSMFDGVFTNRSKKAAQPSFTDDRFIWSVRG